mgnify:CR=1 FL=1
MKRKIIGQLKSWKENPERKPLILLGARQVGKTWVMKHFGQTEFQNVATSTAMRNHWPRNCLQPIITYPVSC